MWPEDRAEPAALEAGDEVGRVECFRRGFGRLDTGTTDSPIRWGADDVEAIEHRHGLRIARIEQVADWR